MATLVKEEGQVGATTIDRPPVLDDTALMGHPRGLGLLFIVEMWERFSYYGMRALLVLYLVNYLKWSDGDASRLYGTYTSLVYLTPLVGGYLADRYIGTRRSLVIGGIIIAMGHFSLAFQTMTMFYVGLALIIVGTGFFKPNVSTMVGQIYKPGDTRRDAGFTIFYMGINLGAFFAPLICGYLGQKVGWHYGFVAAGVGMVLGLIIYLWGRDKYLPGIGLTKKQDAANTAARGGDAIIHETVNMVPGIIGAVVGLVLAFLLHGGWMGYLFGVIIGGAVGTTVFGSSGEERSRVLAIFIVAFFVVFFWMSFEQAGSSMNLFADRHTNLSIGGFNFPSSWFQAVNPLFILAFAPIFASMWVRLGRRGREPSTAFKMVIGLFLLGIGFLFMVAGGKIADTGVKVSALWLTAAYAFHTWGELSLSPVGLSYVTKVAPLRFASLLMGVWFLANAAANKLGGYLASQTENIPSLGRFYMIPVATSLGAAFLLLLLVPLLKRLTRTVQA
ncbi:MAG TPA: peptide MFS transporter [Gemmatimonadaceae bacterium]|nr:peptide MFS transporter [Gemmatimonadaceae bacterium]